MVLGTWLAWGPTAWTPVHPVFDLFTSYNGLTAVVANIVVAAVLSPILRSTAPDQTAEADYDDRGVTA